MVNVRTPTRFYTTINITVINTGNTVTLSVSLLSFFLLYYMWYCSFASRTFEKSMENKIWYQLHFALKLFSFFSRFICWHFCFSIYSYWKLIIVVFVECIFFSSPFIITEEFGLGNRLSIPLLCVPSNKSLMIVVITKTLHIIFFFKNKCIKMCNLYHMGGDVGDLVLNFKANHISLQ